LGIPGEPEVVLWPSELKVHRTISPGWIVTEEGEKKSPPLPTATSTVAPIATVGEKARNVTIVSTDNPVTCNEVFMASAASPKPDRKIQSLARIAPQRKGNAVVTLGVLPANPGR
jgi:hypothetical protein